MALARHRRTQSALFPQELRLFFRRRAQEITGLLLLVLAGWLGAALATYSANDPSFSHAGNGSVRNITGAWGAYTADFLLQSIGLGAFLIILSLVAWSWWLMAHRSPRLALLRLVLWPLAVFGLITIAGGLAAPDSWVVSTSLGGHLGGLLDGQLSTFSNHFLDGALARVAAPLTGLIALLLFLYTIGLSIAGTIGAFTALIPGLKSLWNGSGDLLGRFAGSLDTLRHFQMPQFSWPSFARRRVWKTSHHTPSSDGSSRIEPHFSDTGLRTPARPATAASPPSSARIRKRKKGPAKGQGLLSLEGGSDYALPPLNLLADSPVQVTDPTLSRDALQQNANLLESVLDDFGVKGEIVNVRPGPVVTLYELAPAPGLKSSRVINLADDIARSMSAISARVAVIPGKNLIGIELPNDRRETVYMKELLMTRDYERCPFKLSLVLGKTIGGDPVIANLAAMPHLLIAGTTGSGKSVAINTMILSLLYRLPPDQCKMILIDPKMLELSVYDGIPHLLAPVVTEPRKAVVALKWVVREMEDRYRKMSKIGVRNISGLNQRMADAQARGETITKQIQTGVDPETGQFLYEEEEIAPEQMPFIVVVIDEMADLMMVAGKDIEGAVQRLAQMARAAGIHVIMATQRPSVDVITGTIKANFPTRISFQVTSKIDSRTILGEQGAEQLLGMGDMLHMEGGGRINRVHGPFVSDQEVEDVVATLKKQGTPDYLDAVTEDDGNGQSFTEMMAGMAGMSSGGSGTDELFDQAVAIVTQDRRVSTSYVQRKLQIGYNRAARIIEEMEEQGIISGPNTQGKREVLTRDPGEDSI